LFEVILRFQSSKMPGMLCRACNKKLATSNEIEQHFRGKLHVQKQWQRLNNEGIENKSIHVTRLGSLPLSTIQAYFAQHGTVCNIFIGRNKNNKEEMQYLIFEFEEPEVVQNLLSKDMKHMIQVPEREPPMYWQIQVAARRVKENQRPRDPPIEPCETYSLDLVKERLEGNHNLDDQLQELMVLTELTVEDVKIRSDICLNIYRTFVQHGYVNCSVTPFGSSVNGLGQRGCDLDVYIDLGLIPANSSMLMYNVPVSYTEVQKVHLTARILRTIPQCGQIHSIAQARVPIVKFMHRPTGISCDISFKNRAGTLNSAYIRFCTEFDARVRPLMIAVRTFCKHHELGGGGGGPRLSNYAVTLLVILYLQQLETPILHSVQTLQQYVKDEERVLLNGWDCSFSTNRDILPVLPENKQGVFELLAGFFKFYAKANLSRLLLCPRLARVINKDDLIHSPPQEFPSLPSFLGADESMMTFKNTLTLQDPFELNINVTRNLSEKAVSIMQAYFSEAASLTESLLKPNTKVGGGFLQLLEVKVKINDVKDNLEDTRRALCELYDFKIFLVFHLPVDSTADNIASRAQAVLNLIFKECLHFKTNTVENTPEPGPVVEDTSSTDIGMQNVEDTSSTDIGMQNEDLASDQDALDTSNNDSAASTEDSFHTAAEDLEAVDSLTAPTESTVISTNNQISNAKELDIETEEDANVSENNGDKIFEETDAGTDTAQGNEGNASSKEGGAQTAGDILLNAITKQGKTASSWTTINLSDPTVQASIPQKETEGSIASLKRKSTDLRTGRRKKSRTDISFQHLSSQEWEVNGCVWEGRKKTTERLAAPAELSVLDREAEISRLILDTANLQLEEQQRLVFKSHLAITQGNAFIGLESVKSYKNQYETVFNWLRSYVPEMSRKLQYSSNPVIKDKLKPS